MSIFTFREYYIKVIAGERSGSFSGAIRKALYLISKLYEFVVKTRIFFYKKGIFKRVRLPVPVISVGNITIGGTGKTPVVEYVSKYLRGKGKRVAILSRGYASRIKQNNSSFEDACNDEYLLLRENIPDVPNLLHKDRVKTGLKAIQYFNAEYLVLDDGFQHLRLIRDIDMVVIDALNPFGYEEIIPCGMLREPLRDLGRAGMIILTHVDQCGHDKVRFIIGRLNKLAEDVPVIQTVHKPVCLELVDNASSLDVCYLYGKRVFAFCAIGNPVSFRKSIEGLGCVLLGFRIFPDHHIYTVSELKELNSEAQRNKPDAIIITQKDKVKIKNVQGIWDFPVWVLKMEIGIIKGNEIFENKLNTLLN
ncbi:MAG: tetraacyldisaccharide 4'-kinase [Candidatus Loosdrechtia sp.]|uniref:tetraacyldisaccharide 4'-kinase n=1 Tax=Candidatus Loosdrechtia sp. TaxID=3101272 RepID=UPI003A7092B3|nr:MAG: tetraacyldisaccharide 4'-kinase [Candidatus Jettenia sp. AMX2]